MGMQKIMISRIAAVRPTRSNPSARFVLCRQLPAADAARFDDVEHLGPKAWTSLRHKQDQATDHPGAEIFFDSLCRSGRGRF